MSLSMYKVRYPSEILQGGVCESCYFSAGKRACMYDQKLPSCNFQINKT